MLLTLDMGNTNIKIGVFKDDKLLLDSRIATDRFKMEDQYAVELLDILKLYGVDTKGFEGAIISSVVPPLTSVIRRAVEKITGVTSLVVGPGTKTGINIRIDNPAQLGADLLVGAVAAVEQYGTPCVIWDLGTATTVSVVDRDGHFRGGAIMAGGGGFIE
ncbi:MAG TPA: pantothenate kinase, partial [Ruminococcaceae bacterium]|nr:pantothenate kinase [Oscillospiraceae bacterium]